PWAAKIALPAAASPLPPPPCVVVGAVVDGVVPSTVFGYGRVIVGEFGPEVAPHPARPRTRGMTAMARKNRRIGGASLTDPPSRPSVEQRAGARIESNPRRSRNHETQGLWKGRRTVAE